MLKVCGQEYKTIRPHSLLGQHSPAPATALLLGAGCSNWGPPLDTSSQPGLTRRVILFMGQVNK